jgi:cellulose synthase/poly-beta-1,6-N-acetylglucosamine synthase-like glycosyltransferase
MIFFYFFLLVAIVLMKFFKYTTITKKLNSIVENQDLSLFVSAFPMVSFLIPAWNEGFRVDHCLSSIKALRYPNKQVVVRAGGNDFTYEIAKKHQSDTVIVTRQNPGEGKQVALQKCFELSGGSIIFLTDADCVLDDQSFEKVIRPILDNQEDVTTGSWKPLQKQEKNTFIFWLWLQQIFYEVIAPKYVRSLIGRNAAIKRDVLNQIGQFTMPALIGTDLVLSSHLLQKGYRIRFIHDSRMETQYNSSLRAYIHQASRWIRNAILLDNQNIRIWEYWNRFRSVPVAVFMLFAPLLSLLFNSIDLFILWLLLYFYFLLDQIIVLIIARRRDVTILEFPEILIIFPFLFIDWINRFISIIDIIMPDRRWKW